MAKISESHGLLSGQQVNRRRHALMAASAGVSGALLVIFVIANSATNRSSALIEVSKQLKSRHLSAEAKNEKELVECVAGFGVLGAVLCPTKASTHSLISTEAKKADEVVHTLSPISAPVVASKAPIKADKPVMKAAKSIDSAADADKAKTDNQEEPAQAGNAVMASEEAAVAEPTPIDCACCHSKCVKSGLYKDPKMKAISHSFWCVKQGVVGSPSYCPAQDYNCLCCDRVRIQLGGQSCA